LAVVEMARKLHMVEQPNFLVSLSFQLWEIKGVSLLGRPGLLHSVAGLLTTLINVYTAQSGNWSVTARITAIVTGICTGVTLGLFLVYSAWLLDGVKRDHELQVNAERRSQSVRH